MYTIVEFFFENIFLVIFLIILVFIYKDYKFLKDSTKRIIEQFEKFLNSSLSQKMTEARNIIDRILIEYESDEVKNEINRLLLAIEKGTTGLINDKVEASNAINKFKLSQKIDLEQYPLLNELNNIGTFTEDDMNSVENGVAIARREYNAIAFKYNEKASGFPIQYLTKMLGLNPHFIIFDAPKSKLYEQTYEVFEEEEPEINSLSSLNRPAKADTTNKPIIREAPDINIEHTNTIIKPMQTIDNNGEVK